MKDKIIQYIISLILKALTPDLLRKVADAILDVVESAIASTATDIDDKILLPLIAMLRQAFDIPDDDA